MAEAVVRVTPVLADVSTRDPRVAAAVLLVALGARGGVWVASDTTRATALAWVAAADVAEETQRTIGGGRYEFRYVSRVDAALAHEIVTSSDYHWDALSLMPLGREQLDEAARRVEALDVRRDDLGLPGELVTSYGDGTGVLWVQYPPARAEVEAALGAIAAS